MEHERVSDPDTTVGHWRLADADAADDEASIAVVETVVGDRARGVVRVGRRGVHDAIVGATGADGKEDRAVELIEIEGGACAPRPAPDELACSDLAGRFAAPEGARRRRGGRPARDGVARSGRDGRRTRHERRGDRGAVTRRAALLPRP